MLCGGRDWLLEVSVRLFNERLEEFSSAEKEEVPGHLELTLQVRSLQDQRAKMSAGGLTNRVHKPLESRHTELGLVPKRRLDRRINVVLMQPLNDV